MLRLALQVILLFWLGAGFATATAETVIDYNNQPSTLPADPELQDILKDFPPVNTAGDKDLSQFSREVSQLVKSMLGPEDRAKTVYVVLVDDLRINASYVEISPDRALIALNLGMARFVPDVDELGAALSHELAHGPNKIQEYQSQLRRPQGYFGKWIRRLAENESDIRGALIRMERAGLNPHAASSLLERLREWGGDGPSESHTMTSSREDTLGAALAAKARLGRLQDSRFRLDDKSRTPGWVKALHDSYFDSQRLHDRQQAGIAALRQTVLPQLQETLQDYVRRVENNEADTHHPSLDYTLFDRLFQIQSEEFERIWGDAHFSEEEFEHLLKNIQALDEAIHREVSQLVTKYPPRHPEDLYRLVSLLHRVEREENGKVSRLLNLPLNLRQQLRIVNGEIAIERIRQENPEPGFDIEDSNQRIANHQRSVAKLEKAYAASRRLYLKNRGETEVAAFDAWINAHVEERTNLTEESNLRPIPSRVLGNVVQRSENAIRKLTGTHREMLVHLEMPPELTLHRDNTNLLVPHFRGNDGARLFLHRLRQQVEYQLLTADDVEKQRLIEALREPPERRPGTFYWGDYLKTVSANPSPDFAPEVWVREFLSLLNTHVPNSRGLRVLEGVYADLKNQKLGASVNAAITHGEAERRRIDPLTLFEKDLAHATEIPKALTSLDELNRVLRWSRVPPTAERDNRLKQVARETAHRLHALLSPAEQARIAADDLQVLFWVRSPATTTSHSQPATIRAENRERFMRLAKAYREIYKVDPLPARLTGLFSFNNLVEFDTGRLDGPVSRRVVDMIEAAPRLTVSQTRADQDEPATQTREFQQRLRQTTAVAPSAAHTVLRAGQSIDAEDRDFKPALQRAIGLYLREYFATHPQAEEALTRGVQTLYENEFYSDSNWPSYSPFAKGLWAEVKERYLGNEVPPVDRVRRMTLYLQSVQKGLEWEEAKVLRKLGQPVRLGLVSHAYLPEAELAALYRHTDEKTSPEELDKLIRFWTELARTFPPSIETDLMFNHLWELSERHPHLRDVLRDESLIKDLYFADNRFKLALWQIDRDFSLHATAKDLRSGKTSIPGIKQFRPEIESIAKKIERQLPERTATRNQLVHEVQDLLVTNELETEHLKKLGIDWNNYVELPELAIADLPHQLAMACDTPAERFKLIEYYVGLAPQPPALRLDRLPREMRDHAQVERILRGFRLSFVELSRPARAFIVQAMMGQGEEGVLQSPATSDRMLARILGDRMGNETVRKFFQAYLKALPDSERKVIYSYILATFVEGPEKKASLKSLLEALGPMGIYAGQFLRTSPHLDAQTRKELDHFFNHALPPFREQVIAKAKAAFGSGYEGLVDGIEELRGSGKVNLSFKIRLRSPKTGEVRTVNMRVQKDHIAEQAHAEFLPMQAALTELSQDESPEVRRSARISLEAVTHAYEQIGPGGHELDHAAERAMLKSGAVKRAYARGADGDGIRIEVAKVDQEFQDLITKAFQGKATILENIEHTPLWEIEDPEERAFWSRKIVDAERQALLNYGVFDSDGHPGNWLIDRKNRRLVRVDLGQFQKLSARDHRALRATLTYLISENPGRGNVQAMRKAFSHLFQLSEMPPDLSDRLTQILVDPNLPPASQPEERLYYLQDQLEKSYRAGRPNLHVGFTPPMRNAVASLSRILMYREHTGLAPVQASLFKGLPWLTQARVAVQHLWKHFTGRPPGSPPPNCDDDTYASLAK